MTLIRPLFLSALVALFFVLPAAQTEGHHRKGGRELRNGCHRLYPMARFYRYTERRYRIRSSLTKGQRGYILRMARCQHSKKAQRWALRKRRLYIHRRARRLAMFCGAPVCNLRLVYWMEARRSNGTQGGCLRALAFRESRGDERAQNPSGAYGIPQALPGSKMASAGPDWSWNPVTQIRWMIGYVRARYGSACGALAHSNSTSWY